MLVHVLVTSPEEELPAILVEADERQHNRAANVAAHVVVVFVRESRCQRILARLRR